MILRRVAREPLVHFLVAGGLLFLIFNVVHRQPAGGEGDRTITIDDRALLNFLQYRSNAFKPEYFSGQLSAMSPADRKRIEDEYLQEEVLYREAKSLGLEEGDYVIRQELVQKMRFLLQNQVESNDRPTDAVLDAYLGQHRDRYLIAASVTFTHVFVDASVHGDAAARRAAEALKARLNASGAGFNDAPRYGDRFPYLQNYVGRTLDYVGSDFGGGFADALQAAMPSDTQWIGPIRSRYGYHVVLLTARTDERLPALAEIRQQVEGDWRHDREEQATSDAMARLAAQYHVVRGGRETGE